VAASGLTQAILRRHAPMSREEERRVGRLSKRDPAALERLVLANSRYVAKIAWKWAFRTGQPVDDVFQMGLIGAMRAAQKYDPERGTRFITYATAWINVTIEHWLERTGVQVRSIQRVVTRKDPRLLWRQVKGTHLTSLEAPMKEGGDPLVDMLVAQGEDAGEMLDAGRRDEAVRGALAQMRLTPVERDVLYNRLLGEVASLDVISRRHAPTQPWRQADGTLRTHLSRERVRQIEKRLIERLRVVLADIAEAA
jgi:RNA polymerase sigma factor (sigma-70 family)